MAYRVFENNQRCGNFGISKWCIDTFPTKREAEIHAYLWAYPVTKQEAEKSAPTMELNVPVDYSTCEFPVMMEIREITD